MNKAFFSSGQIKGEDVEATRSKFNKWFKNEIIIISLEHKGRFGRDVEIIAKVTTSGMNHFYSYDKNSNNYRLFVPKRKWIDEQGYTHFITDVAGDIIISRGALTRRR